jgi:predicted patatin/cPLA2 family phospholipase
MVTAFCLHLEDMMKTGLIVEGGGMKCAYSAGILDAFLDENITFDYCIGVSAGAANTLSYLAGQRERNLRFYTEHLDDPRYLSLKSLFSTGNLFGLQYIYGTLTNSDGADPLDYSAVMKNPTEFYMAATNARTGKAVYFSKNDLIPDDYRPVMASCALPCFCRPVQWKDNYYYDGGVADSIPVQHALDHDCDKLVVILSNPRGFEKQPEAYRSIYKRMLRKYPKTVEGIDNRHINYRHSIALANKLEKKGTAFIFAPSRQLPLSTFSKDAALEQQLYDLGLEDYQTKTAEFHRFLQQSVSSPHSRVS